MSNYRYIFDTSALFYAKKTDIIAASEKVKISLSPISVYERICHFDNKNEKKSFERKKGDLLKCGLFEILHDPFAEFTASIGIANNINPTRFEEPYVLTQLLDRLKESKSLEEFYKKEVRFPNGDIGLISDIADRARKAFDEENSRYIAHVITLYKILNDTGLNYSTIKANDFIKICKNASLVFSQSYNIDDELFEAKIFSSTYAYAAYKLARLLEYQRKAIENNTDFCIEKNDTEDSFICLHLNMVNPIVLVTNDKGTVNALSLSSCYLDEVFSGKGKVFNLLVMVIDYDTFKKEYA